MNTKFSELNLSSDLLKSIEKMGFVEATPIQAQAIPEVLAGHDVIGQASTGTGKTAAFGLPIIDKVDSKNKAVQALILCPTRELAMQVAAEITKFLKFKRGVFALPVYGGQPISRQIYGLRKGVQIVIGTPGRVMDHIDRGTLRLNQVKMMVLDEADEMLNMGFRQDIEKILEAMKQEKQTVLFSATMSREILRLTKRYQKNPKLIKVVSEKLSAPNVEQSYFAVEQSRKVDALMDLLNFYKPKLSIVFCNTRRQVDKIDKLLHSYGYRCAGIHGDIRQPKRDKIMGMFRKGSINILVATDVAARGIDVADIEIVFNYELPKDVEPYVHRIGRTGRAGKSGKAFNLVSRREIYQLRDIQRYTKVRIEQQEVPRPNSDQAQPVAPKIDAPRFDDSRASASERTGQERVRPERKKIDFSADGQTFLEEKASRIFGKVRKSISKNELTGYLGVMEKFVGSDGSSADVAAALLKMVLEVEGKKSQSNRYQNRYN